MRRLFFCVYAEEKSDSPRFSAVNRLTDATLDWDAIRGVMPPQKDQVSSRVAS